MIRECVLLALIFFAVSLFLPDSAWAGYLDPGSGSSLVQGIIAFFASIRRFFFRLIGKKEE